MRRLIVAILGVYLGAMLTEGFVLVPYWRSLPAADFFAWYAANDGRWFGFFGAVTVSATLAVVAWAVMSLWSDSAGKWHAALAAALIIAVVLMFPLYFEDTNARFASGSVAPDDLAAALARWAAWHWLRTGLVAAALAASMLSMPNHRAGAGLDN